MHQTDMELIAWCWLFLLPGMATFQQDLFTLKFERAIMVRYDKSLITSAKIGTFKYNRTQAAINVTIDCIKEFGNSLKVEVQAYKFASNEYRLFPIRFAFDFCAMAKSNDFGMADLLKCGNLACPLKKGVYHICNFFPDAARFPPLIPAGSYMIDLKHFYDSTEAFFIQGYGIIEYPLT